MAAAALGEQLYGLGDAVLAITTISISASASAAPWCMTAPCCAAPGAMPARSAISRSCRTASPAPAAIAAAWSAISRSRRYRPPRPSARRTGSTRSRPIFRNAIATIENLFDPADRHPRRPRPAGAARPRWRRVADRLPNSVSARRDRTAPRVIVAQRRPACGAARRRGAGGRRRAVAALRPDVRRGRATAIGAAGKGWRHDANRCWCSTTSPRTTAPSKR